MPSGLRGPGSDVVVLASAVQRGDEAVPQYIEVILGIMENKMETTRVYRDSIGYIMVYYGWVQGLRI